MTDQQRKETVTVIRSRWFDRPLFLNPTVGTDFARNDIRDLLHVIEELTAPPSPQEKDRS